MPRRRTMNRAILGTGGVLLLGVLAIGATADNTQERPIPPQPAFAVPATTTTPPVTTTPPATTTTAPTRTAEPTRTAAPTRTPVEAPREPVVAPVRTRTPAAESPASDTTTTSTLEPERDSEPESEREPADVTYSSCDEARAAGAAPLDANDPGYSRRLDRDGDGTACDD